jgi:DNA primase
VTWIGGASAVSKTDWSPLVGREIVVWPDNDKAGFEAAESVYSELRKVGVSSLKSINMEYVEKSLPEKWDLADPLPNGVKERDLKDMIILGDHRACNPRSVVFQSGMNSDKDPLKQLQANEILWRVDERMRFSLEKEHGLIGRDVNDKIIKESVKLLRHENELRDSLQQTHGVRGEVLERLKTQALLYQADQGKDPSQNEVESMKQVICKIGSTREIEKELNQGKDYNSLAIDKGIEKACELSKRKTQSRSDLQECLKKEAIASSAQMSKNLQRDAAIQQAAQQQQELQRSMSSGIER